MEDREYMARALALAARAQGRQSPNPYVGAVIVRDGEILGEGWHEVWGGAHAEVNALAACTRPPEGGTLYVTLEPCCHQGKTPPCTQAILAAGIRRVCVGTLDPNPLVAGQGVEILRRGGVEVEVGLLGEECRRSNAAFFHFIRTHTPYVRMKWAMSLDGKIATVAGESRWITGETARRRVHEDRNRYAAILVGVETLRADDPQLTCRLPGGRNPLRIVCDSRLRTPLESVFVRTAKTVPSLLATCCREESRLAPYRARGVECLSLPETAAGQVDLPALMQALGARNIDSLLLEGGATLHYAALAAGVVQSVQCYIAPKLIGGQAAKGPVGGAGFAALSEALALQNLHITPLGEDILIEGEL